MSIIHYMKIRLSFGITLLENQIKFWHNTAWPQFYWHMWPISNIPCVFVNFHTVGRDTIICVCGNVSKLCTWSGITCMLSVCLWILFTVWVDGTINECTIYYITIYYRLPSSEPWILQRGWSWRSSPVSRCTSPPHPRSSSCVSELCQLGTRWDPM